MRCYVGGPAIPEASVPEPTERSAQAQSQVQVPIAPEDLANVAMICGTDEATARAFLERYTSVEMAISAFMDSGGVLPDAPKPRAIPQPEPTTPQPTSHADEHEHDEDYELAQLLQAQFNEEHNNHISTREAHINRHNGSKVSISMHKYRQQETISSSVWCPDNEPRRLTAEDAADGESDDDYHPEMELTYDPSVREMRNEHGEIVTKHNPQAQSLRNQRRMEESLPLSFPSGDMKKGDVRVSNKVYNKIKRDANKRDRSQARVKEAKDTSTSDLALDTKTRLLLFRMVNAGILEEINGAISTGKEAIVFHASRRTDPRDPRSALEECAIKVFKTTLTEFKQRQQFLHGDRRYEDRVGRQSARKLVKMWASKLYTIPSFPLFFS